MAETMPNRLGMREKALIHAEGLREGRRRNLINRSGCRDF